jgi:hypothetical protein
MKSFIDIVEEIKNIISSEYNGRKVFDKDVADLLGISQMNFATMKKLKNIHFNNFIYFFQIKNKT